MSPTKSDFLLIPASYEPFQCNKPLLPYKCFICSNLTHYKIQNLIHTCHKKNLNKVVYKHCKKCRVLSFSKLWLFLHQKQCKYRFECAHCDYKAGQKGNLKNHMVRFHATDAKPYQCELCLFATHRVDSMKSHMKSKHKPSHMQDWFCCDHCDFRSNKRANLKRHITVKHSTGRKKFKCKECSFAAHTKDHLQKHIKSRHIPTDLMKWFECDQCDFRTRQQSYLKIHMTLKHSIGERKYKCEYCPYQSHKGSHVRDHTIHQHTPESKIKWVECEFCTASVKSKTALRYHIKCKHSK